MLIGTDACLDVAVAVLTTVVTDQTSETITENDFISIYSNLISVDVSEEELVQCGVQ